MESQTPFAYGPAGGVLVATDDRWVCVSPEADAGPLWGFEAAARVAGVRNTPNGILAIDANGLLTRLNRADGKVLGRIDCGVPAARLIAAGDVWAVLHANGVCIGRGDKLHTRMNLPGVTCAALDETGHRLGIATQDGDVGALDLGAVKRRTLRLGTPIAGLAWSRLGWWLVATGHKVHRADADLSGHRALIASDQPVSGCVASPDGDLCAFRVGRKRLVVVGSEGKQLGTLSYTQREVGEIEFGPFPWLGVGIGAGDGNRVSLLDGAALYRTDPPLGRPRHTWLVALSFDGPLVRKERARLRAQGVLPEEAETPLLEAADEIVTLERATAEPVDVPTLLESAEAPEMEEARPTPKRRRIPRPPGTPFVLEPGERVLIRGGFGGQGGWSWLAGVGIGCLLFAPCVGLALFRGLADGNVPSALVGLVFLMLGLFVASLPYLLSGTYWLTNLRLHFKPRLGAAVAVPFADIDADRIRVGVLTSSLYVKGPRPVSLRYIRGLERLWGGLILFSQLGEVETTPAAERTEEVACWPAFSQGGLSSQRGMAVLRPGYFAFLPSEGKVNLLAQLGTGLGNQVAGQAVGVQWVSARAKLPVDLLLQVLYERDAESFDRYVFQAVQQLDGLLWEPGEAKLVKEAFPLQPNRHVLLFKQKGQTVRGVPTPEQQPFVESVLPRWSRGKPVPVRQPVAGMVLVAVMLTVPALLLIWGGYFDDRLPDTRAVGSRVRVQLCGGTRRPGGVVLGVGAVGGRPVAAADRNRKRPDG